MTISVILPVYNVEIYLPQCLDSIITQDYLNLEIILINDGSTDSSGMICDSYALKDSRITVIHQQNKGISEARNAGLKYASGDFISFIDSDDWINSGMYSCIMENISDDIDVVYIPHPTPKRVSSIKKLDKKDIQFKFLPHFIGKTRLSLGSMASVWSLFIRRKLVEGLYFSKANFTEDKLYFIETVLRADSLLIIPQKFYNYRENPNSITRKYYKTFVDDVSLINKEITYILEKYKVKTKELENLHNNSILNLYHHLIKNEAENETLVLPNPALAKYYKENDLCELLTWPKTFKALLSKPKFLLIKLGYSDTVLRRKWAKRQKRMGR
ncbi:glycosyltransferase family 2 protein [Dysgonomonas macrotermitis]|uniref:Glycosyltransferase involved in cell wall bisynthesis n=1 Tax=Dysgonomonas macrotermitis TaxID=1346286 RepID=A0A1M5H0G8_9BACT|nr:glycosyltransferase [Dysgonomonas macrotermitis]SHG09415.1 Glycosyltransferase involved in cell wall bisynthesis [Dysgonomonas macrotermitis]